MTLREFFKYHLLKVLLGLVVLQLIILTLIQNYNHRPVTVADYVETLEDNTLKISPISNDSDKDKEDELTFKNISSPRNGTIEQKTNRIYYTPNNSFFGLDSLTYTITDGGKESEPTKIVIKVIKNLPPLTAPDVTNVYAGSSIMINLLGNDSDGEGDSIFIESYTQPQSGQLKEVNGKLVYVAENTTAQTDKFTYIASDGKRNSDATTVQINIKGKNDPCYPWLSSDVGDVAIAGSSSCTNNKTTIEASGSDIWNNQDGFHFAYQYVSGNCEMITKVEDLEGNHEWAKAGVMIRETLDGGSKMAIACVSNRSGIAWHQRQETNAATYGGDPEPNITVPYWVKINRTGDAFSFYKSADGKNWRLMGNTTIPMAKNVYIGLAVTSHDNNELCKTVFSNIKLKGKTAKF
ncbi:MAG: cadherin-like domain-containing protein [Prolixibacteraceae bacterium]|nr:cadherin-like domain-containing protein [Prolixibacteraceae bacterium]